MTRPTLLWLRRDLRLADHPGWQAALAAGGPVIPVFLLDPVAEVGLGAAPAWRLEQSLGALARDLGALGSRLVLRRGQAAESIGALAAETGAARVVWSRLYDPAGRARDAAVEAALTARGVAVETVNASLLFEPWTVETRTGGFFKVYTPFWRATAERPVRDPLPAPARLAPPEVWPASEDLATWRLGRRMARGAAVVARFARIGEAAASERLASFLADRLARYGEDRDRLDLPGTSKLAENLTWGEISPATCWTRATTAMAGMEPGARESAGVFLKELIWREFSYHLLWHTPHLLTANWKPDWDAFPWEGESVQAEAWRRGRTGIEVVDAGMRELYVTGTMHNRARMLVASFLTKHLMTHWQIGEAWFRDCLIDWDPAANAMGWQWAAGSGPDAAPYFRIFNPDTQAERFDPHRAYRDRFLAEGRRRPHADALAFFDAAPRAWRLDPAAPPARPLVGLAEGRARALAAFARKG